MTVTQPNVTLASRIHQQWLNWIKVVFLWLGLVANSKIKTCEKYRDGAGKLRYKGTSHLKSTELLGCCCSQGMLSCYHMIDDHLNVV